MVTARGPASTGAPTAVGTMRQPPFVIWLVSAVAGALTGYLALYLWIYATVRFGDNVPLLALEGTLGTTVGWAVLTLPFLGLGLALLLTRRLPSRAWIGLLVISVGVVAAIPHPPSIDCGNNITGYTCAGTSSSPSEVS
jgi:drug/metabolite transporter (DMT)-like permease